MIFKREELARHLQRIACGGQIRQAVFGGAFQTHALTPDHLLFVTAPALPGESISAGEFGLADLAKLIGALSMVPGSAADADVEIRLEAERLVVDEPGRHAQVILRTAAPRTIETMVQPEVAVQLRAKMGTQAVPLTPELVGGIRNTFSGLKATSVELVVGPTGGLIRVGDINDDRAEFATDVLTAPTPYTLKLGEHLIDVLGVLTSAAPVLYLGGPGALITVQDGEHWYMMSPRNPGADAKRAEAKPEKTKKAKTE